jgi:hypothetical protein
MPMPEPALWSLEWWKDAVGIAQSAFVCVTALIALLGVNEWRRQTIGKRKIELAEQVLTSFYEARDVFVWVRSPAAFGGEGETRQAEGEHDDVRRMRNVYFVPIERMQKHGELFARIQGQRYSFMAVFGADAVRPFELLREVQVRISISAQTLIRMVGNDPARVNNQALFDRCEADIWEGMYEATNQVDPLKASLVDMITRLETLCRPVLLHSGPWTLSRLKFW